MIDERKTLRKIHQSRACKYPFIMRPFSARVFPCRELHLQEATTQGGRQATPFPGPAAPTPLVHGATADRLENT